MITTHDSLSPETTAMFGSLINGPSIAVVSGDKESCVVIMNGCDCFKKLQHMIDEGIQNGVYIVTEDKTFRYTEDERSETVP